MIKLFKFFKPLLKLLTSGELVELFDNNKDGKVTWKEIWAGLKNPEVLGELALKIGGTVLAIKLL
jgi:hypothetical protein